MVFGIGVFIYFELVFFGKMVLRIMVFRGIVEFRGSFGENKIL